MKFRVVAATLLTLISSVSPASSIVNGSPAVGSSYVVALLNGEEGQQSICTGAYLRPRVVVTAAHCVIKPEGRAPELRLSIDQFYVSQPGIDLKSPDARQSRVRVLKVWTEPDYFNRWQPEKNLMETQVNDVAFLFLEKELEGVTLTRAATRDEIEDFRLGNKSAFHLGYGMIGGPGGVMTSNDGKPYLVEGIVGNQSHQNHIPLHDRHLMVMYPFGKSIAPGDSGSPLMMNKGNEVLYLGTIYAGGASVAELAKGNTSVRGTAAVTVLWPFVENLDQQWSKFLAEEVDLRKLQEEATQKLIRARSDALQQNTFYKDESGCHAIGINAELQGLLNGKWVSVAETKGWDKAPNCSTTHPVQPWTFATLKEGLELRWRFWLVNQFDVYGPQFRAGPVTEAKASRDKAASTKKVTIICNEGKLTKKVTAVKPKCPKGFVKKGNTYSSLK